jgi:hypothetical protein
VIIVDPDEIARTRDFPNGVAEDLVYAAVRIPEFILIDHVRGERVEQRPDGLVAEAEIKALHGGFGEKNRVR